MSLRSAQWYEGSDRNAYIHRAWMRRGLPGHAFDGRPQIAIANTASDLTPCNSHLDEVATSVKQGVWEAGGVPLNLPVVSLGETQVRPTAMLWRNLAAMATEEMLRANPVDGVVLLGGCDKTIPALLMAAASGDLPGVGVGDDPQPWPLQHHGHGLDHGLPGRGPRDHHPRPGRHPGPRQPPARAGPPERPAGRRAGRRRPAAQHLSQCRVVPQRDRGPGGHRRGRPPGGC